jgi:hypothetical protein
MKVDLSMVKVWVFATFTGITWMAQINELIQALLSLSVLVYTILKIKNLRNNK